MYSIDAGKSLANGSYLLGFTKPDNRKNIGDIELIRFNNSYKAGYFKPDLAWYS